MSPLRLSKSRAWTGKPSSSTAPGSSSWPTTSPWRPSSPSCSTSSTRVSRLGLTGFRMDPPPPRLPEGPCRRAGSLPAVCSGAPLSRVLGLYTGGCGDLPAPPRGSRWGCQDLSLEPQLLSGLCPSPQSTRRPCLASCFSFGEKSEFPSHLLTPHPHPTPSLLGPRLWPRLSPYC